MSDNRDFGLRIGAADVGVVAGEPPLPEPVVPREARRTLVASAPSDPVEIFPGLVDRVGGTRESDVPAQETIEVLALPHGLVRTRLSRASGSR